MKFNLPFIVLIVSVVGAIAENATNGTINVTKRPKATTTTTAAPNFISSTLDNIRKFFFSEFTAFSTRYEGSKAERS